MVGGGAPVLAHGRHDVDEGGEEGGGKAEANAEKVAGVMGDVILRADC